MAAASGTSLLKVLGLELGLWEGNRHRGFVREGVEGGWKEGGELFQGGVNAGLTHRERIHPECPLPEPV